MSRHDEALQRMFVPPELVSDSTSDVLRQNLSIMGSHLDDTEDNATLLKKDLFPDDSSHLLSDYERVFQLSGVGTVSERQSKVVSAHRARGGLSKAYFEGLGNTMGGGDYTVNITEGTGGAGFIIHEHSSLSSPTGPATILPGQLYTTDTTGTFYNITCTVVGDAGPIPELEDMYNRLKPCHTDWTYAYIP
jgi:uncharacterized protein YmfQ (DUF2313 family)